MKKLLTLCTEYTLGCIKAEGYRGDRYIVEKEYSDEEYQAIRDKADKYEIYVYSSEGYDYGYGREGCETSESSRNIEDYQIVVSQDGICFAGVVGASDYYGFNKESYRDKELHVTLVDDPSDGWKKYPLIYKTGSSFSSDDHERWDYSYYYLRKK